MVVVVEWKRDRMGERGKTKWKSWPGLVWGERKEVAISLNFLSKP